MSLHNHTNHRAFDSEAGKFDSIFKDQSLKSIRNQLFLIFRLAVIGGLENQTGLISPENVARLFDDLNDLVALAHQQYQNTPSPSIQDRDQHV